MRQEQVSFLYVFLLISFVSISCLHSIKIAAWMLEHAN